MILGILVVVLTLAAVAAVTRPWWASAFSARMSRTGANVAAYRLRFAEIDQELAAGNLQPAAADALKLELQQRLLQDAAVEAEPQPAPPRARIALAVAAFVPLFAGAWYYQAGSWRVQEQVDRAGAAAPQDAQAMQIEAMVQRLEQRLQQQPGDAQGWAMLGRSYFVLKRYAESAQAYARANALTNPPDPELLVAQGGAIGLAAGGDLSGRPRELFDAALKISPDHMRALWFAGQAALQADDFDGAQNFWERLLRQELPDDLRADVQARVQELAVRTGRKAQVAAAAPSEPQSAAANPAAPAADKAGPSLHVTVSIAPALAARRKADQVLYVFAKAAQGPPMPLAVRKLHPQSWPVELTLDDTMAMAPALRLSQFEHWIVTARLGAEGSPTAQPGDLQGRAAVARAQGAQSVDIVISEEVK